MPSFSFINVFVNFLNLLKYCSFVPMKIGRDFTSSVVFLLPFRVAQVVV